MRLVVATLCEAATIHDAILNILGAGVSIAHRQMFPTQFGITLALQFVIDPGELGQDVLIDVTVSPVGGDFVARGTITFSPAPPEGDEPPNAPGTIPFVIPLQGAIIAAPGDYVVTVSLGGEAQQSLPIRFVHSPTEAGPALTTA